MFKWFFFFFTESPFSTHLFYKKNDVNWTRLIGIMFFNSCHSFAKVVSLCWNLQSILMDILCRLNAKFWQILVKVEKPVFVSFLFYCFSVSLCLPQISATVKYVNWICPISRKLLDSYICTGNLLDWMQDIESFSGLGLTNDDVRKCVENN